MTCVSSSLSVLAHSTPVHLSPGNSWEIHFPPSRASPPFSPRSASPGHGTGGAVTEHGTRSLPRRRRARREGEMSAVLCDGRREGTGRGISEEPRLPALQNTPSGAPADRQTDRRPSARCGETGLAKPAGVRSFLLEPLALPRQHGALSPRNFNTIDCLCRSSFQPFLVVPGGGGRDYEA